MSLARTYVILLALLILTVVFAHAPLGPWNTPVALGIAAVKTVLVGWIFMEVREASGLLRIAPWFGISWLAVLVGLSLSDYLTRG
jgi:cytochrome c oxidase subunit 4